MRGSPYELQLKLVGWPLCKRPLRILEVFRIVRARADARDFQQLDSLGCCVAPLLYPPLKNMTPTASHLEAASISSCTCLIREARLMVGSRIRKVSIIRVRG